MHGFPNLPIDMPGWRAIVEPSQNAYWQALRDGQDQTSALLTALDTALGIVEKHNTSSRARP